MYYLNCNNEATKECSSFMESGDMVCIVLLISIPWIQSYSDFKKIDQQYTASYYLIGRVSFKFVSHCFDSLVESY